MAAIRVLERHAWAGAVASLGVALLAAACTGTGTVALALVPPPQVPAAAGRGSAATVQVHLEAVERRAELAPSVEYEFWTFNGTVPGPMLRVRLGDTVELTLRNEAASKHGHNIDLHAVTGPGGGAAVTNVAPGQQATFRFKALHPGLYVYHCAFPPVSDHIANGMYGLILVEPPKGLPKVNRELYVVQGDFYTAGAFGERGYQPYSRAKMLAEAADYVVFNGAVGSLTGANAAKARVGETMRIYFGAGGPNTASAFHVIGEIFDTVYPEAGSALTRDVQTTLVPPGGAAMVELTFQVPGTYLLVDHAISRVDRGALGQIVVEGTDAPDVFAPVR